MVTAFNQRDGEIRYLPAAGALFKCMVDAFGNLILILGMNVAFVDLRAVLNATGG